MAERKDRSMDRKRFLVIAALAGAVAGVIGVYVIAPVNGNRGNAGICAAAAVRNAAIAEFARGEVAAMTVADKSETLVDLAFTQPDGAPATLDDWSGKAILLNLWATWCMPCRREMPGLDRLQAELGGKAFEVVAVNIDTRDPDKPNRFLDEIGVATLKRYRDGKADIFKVLRAKGLAFGMPTTLLVDKAGCLVGHMAGAAEWDSDDAKALVRAVIGTAD